MLGVSGLWSADLSCAQLHSCSADARSTLFFRSSVFWNVCSPLRSRSPDFLPAPLRFLLRSHALPVTHQRQPHPYQMSLNRRNRWHGDPFLDNLSLHVKCEYRVLQLQCWDWLEVDRASKVDWKSGTTAYGEPSARTISTAKLRASLVTSSDFSK